MFFDDAELSPRKQAALRAPPIPVTGWRPPASFPNLSDAVALSVDVETYDPELTVAGPGWARKRGHIVGVSIGAEDARGNRGAWYFPMRHEIERENNLDPASVFPWLKHALEKPLPKVGANLLYDVGWLTEESIFVKGKLFDVQFAEALLDETAKVALEVLGQKYLNEGKDTNLLYEWIRQAFPTNGREIRSHIYHSPPSLVGHYAESDADLPLRIIARQMPLLASEGLLDLFRLECDLIPLLVEMRREGVSVDVAKAEQMRHELQRETVELYKRVKHEYGVGLDSCSTANLSMLFDSVGINYPRTEPTKTKPDGNPSFEKEWLKALEHPLGELINDIREHEKIIGTFLEAYIINKNVNGKLYPQFHPLKGDKNGTLVGRFASSDPNLQNIPSRTKLGKKVRQCFIPDANHVKWQKNDYSQIHYRLLAHFAIDNSDGSADALRARYINDPATDYHMDVYRNVAPMLGWSLTDEEEIKVKRRPIKNVNFGLLYGQTEKALAYKAGFSKEQAAQFFKSYHAAAPYVKSTMAEIGREVQQYGYVRTVLGRRVRFNYFEPAGFGERQQPLPFDLAIRKYGTNIRRAYEYRGVNYKLQGSEPDLMKTGMVKCYHSGVFDFVGVPRITVHDELDFSVRDDCPQTREAFKFIQHTMQEAVKLRVPVKVDVSTGPNWGSAD